MRFQHRCSLRQLLDHLPPLLRLLLLLLLLLLLR